MMKFAYSASFSALLLWSSVVAAQSSNPGVTPNEWRLLPEGCLYAEFGPEFRSPTARRLREADKTWVAMHHYCWAIVQEFRTFRSSMPPSDARLILAAAIHNLDYVIVRSKPGFIYRADMFVRKARMQARRGELIQAADTARLLIAESPTLPEGYIALADVQIRAGQLKQARETLARGDAEVDDKERFGALKSSLPPH